MSEQKPPTCPRCKREASPHCSGSATCTWGTCSDCGGITFDIPTGHVMGDEWLFGKAS